MLGRGCIRPAETEFYCWVGVGFYLSYLCTEVLAPGIFEHIHRNYRKLPRPVYLEWNARFTSTVHAVLISIGCIGALLFIPHLWNDRLFSTDYFSEVIISMSTGYMIYDLVTMPMYLGGFGLLTYIVHHGIAIFGNTIVVTQSFGKFYLHYKLLTELSTPFINIRWLLRQADFPSSHPAVSVSTLCFGVTFALVRLVGSIPFWFMYHRSVALLDTQEKRDLISSMSVYVYLFGIGLDMLNLLWFSVIVSLCLRAAKDVHAYLKQKRQQTTSTLQILTPNGEIHNGHLPAKTAEVALPVT